MELIQTYIKDLCLVRTEHQYDSRGSFHRSYCSKEFERIGIHETFVQTNISHNIQKGLVRGMHLQLPPFAETKLIRCVRGKVYDVAIDLRRGSATFLKYYGVELTSENALALFIPVGFAHGFQVMEEHSTLLYMHSAYYHPSSEFSLSCLESKVGINWPLEITAWSEKDSRVKYLDEQFEGIEV